MQVGAFCGEFSGKGLAICGLPKRIGRETTLFMPMLVVRIVDLSRHPFFSVTMVLMIIVHYQIWAAGFCTTFRSSRP